MCLGWDILAESFLKFMIIFFKKEVGIERIIEVGIERIIDKCPVLET